LRQLNCSIQGERRIYYNRGQYLC